MTPEEESKAATLEEYHVIAAHSTDFGWQADLDDKGDFCVIFVLLVAPRDQRSKLLAKLTCDDYPKSAPLLEFVNPEALENKALRGDVREEFYPKGKGIANDKQRSPLPIVCMAGHRLYHANGWHTSWKNPPPHEWRTCVLVQQMGRSWIEDWS